MNTKMNRLALCALLLGLLPAVNGDDDVDRWLKMNSVQLFNELKTPEGCENAFGKLGMSFGDKMYAHRRYALVDLAERLNFLCDFWEWFGEAKFQPDDIRKLFTDPVPGGKDRVDRRKLIFLRDTKWGEEVKEDNGTKRDKFDNLKAMCRVFI